MKVNRNFTIIPNDLVNDERLTFEALGLLTYLLSQPDDWRVVPGQIKNRGGVGRNKTYQLIKELAIVRAARRAGTGDPVAYVTRALSEALPPPQNPKTFTPADWTAKLQAAINTKQWSPAWGPPPGKKKSFVPPNLITPELVSALSRREPSNTGMRRINGGQSPRTSSKGWPNQQARSRQWQRHERVGEKDRTKAACIFNSWKKLRTGLFQHGLHQRKLPT